MYDCLSVRPFLRKLVSQFLSYRDFPKSLISFAGSFPKSLILQVVYKSEPAGSDVIL